MKTTRMRLFGLPELQSVIAGAAAQAYWAKGDTATLHDRMQQGNTCVLKLLTVHEMQ